MGLLGWRRATAARGERPAPLRRAGDGEAAFAQVRSDPQAGCLHGFPGGRGTHALSITRRELHDRMPLRVAVAGMAAELAPAGTGRGAPGPGRAIRVCATLLPHRLVCRRSALATTETEDRLMASAAIMGLSNRPDTGYSRPAAMGTPSAL